MEKNISPYPTSQVMSLFVIFMVLKAVRKQVNSLFSSSRDLACFVPDRFKLPQKLGDRDLHFFVFTRGLYAPLKAETGNK